MVTEERPPDIIAGMATRQCRDCGEEYRPDAQVSACSDCGGAIEWQDDSPRTPGSPPPGTLPEGPYRALYRTEASAELEPLAKRLADSGIPFGVRGGVNAGGGGRFVMWVSAAQIQAARTAVSDLLGDGVPVDEDFDPQQGYGRCPSCDAEVTPGVPDCPGCGLAVGPIDAVPCPSCGAACDPDAVTCPSCGH
jgi:hypothetical protein